MKSTASTSPEKVSQFIQVISDGPYLWRQFVRFLAEQGSTTSIVVCQHLGITITQLRSQHSRISKNCQRYLPYDIEPKGGYTKYRMPPDIAKRILQVISTN